MRRTAMSTVRAAVAFVLVALLWGIPFALIAISLDDGASPLFIAWFRVAVGAVALAVIAYAPGQSMTVGSPGQVLLGSGQLRLQRNPAARRPKHRHRTRDRQ